MNQPITLLPPQETGDRAAFARAVVMVARRLAQQQTHMVQSPSPKHTK
jgi:hypothetical protein